MVKRSMLFKCLSISPYFYFVFLNTSKRVEDKSEETADKETNQMRKRSKQRTAKQLGRALNQPVGQCPT